MHCEDCGTRLCSGVCPNCQEELYIFTEQNEYMPKEGLSPEFMNKVDEQTQASNKNRREYFKRKNSRQTSK